MDKFFDGLSCVAFHSGFELILFKCIKIVNKNPIVNMNFRELFIRVHSQHSREFAEEWFQTFCFLSTLLSLRLVFKEFTLPAS